MMEVVVLLVLVSVTSFPAAARKGGWEGEANTADISFSVNRLSYDSLDAVEVCQVSLALASGWSTEHRQLIMKAILLPVVRG